MGKTGIKGYSFWDCFGKGKQQSSVSTLISLIQEYRKSKKAGIEYWKVKDSRGNVTCINKEEMTTKIVVESCALVLSGNLEQIENGKQKETCTKLKKMVGEAIHMATQMTSGQDLERRPNDIPFSLFPIVVYCIVSDIIKLYDSGELSKIKD